ncbi:hypothetical protein N431DRAFT_428896 [Stipitochalara longipes BDJ]|nr:hypothetical protein N431DRAFT_428896 [Stipitochalara longipes BDJ]
MPRPKRTKVAPSAPAPRVTQLAKTTKIAVEAQSAPVPNEPKNDLYDISDGIGQAVRSVRHVKKNNGKAKVGAASMSHGRTTETSTRNSEERDIERAHKGLQTSRAASEAQGEESDGLDLDLGSSSPAEVGRKEMRTPAVESSLLAIGNFKRRARQPSILGGGAARARSSSVESNLAQDNGLTSVGKRNASMMSIGKFKRRPRQPSILGQSAAPVVSSSMGLEMDRGTPAQVGSALKIGNFKRRARESSILGTAQKNQPQRLEYDDDEDDFNPEDESTPLNLSKTRNVNTSSASSSSNPRKRKLSSVQVPRSSPSLPSPRRSEPEETIPATSPLSDEEADGSELGSPEPDHDLMPSIEGRSVTPEPLSETMAPPHSSSSVSSSPEPALPLHRAPSRGRRPLRGRTPPPMTQDSPISSPPSLTHSPDRPAVAATKPKPKPKRQPPPPSTFSTAQLQSLLPRRRRRQARDPFDIPSSEDEVDVSGLASEDDELSHLTVRARSRRSTVPRRTPAPLKGPRSAKAAAKGKQPATKRTYGAQARAASDKENEGEVDPDDSLGPLPDDAGNESPENSQELVKRVGQELKAAARKFEEVDKWELDFEEVTASSSSPKDAR